MVLEKNSLNVFTIHEYKNSGHLDFRLMTILASFRFSKPLMLPIKSSLDKSCQLPIYIHTFRPHIKCRQKEFSVLDLYDDESNNLYFIR